MLGVSVHESPVNKQTIIQRGRNVKCCCLAYEFINEKLTSSKLIECAIFENGVGGVQVKDRSELFMTDCNSNIVFTFENFEAKLLKIVDSGYMSE